MGTCCHRSQLDLFRLYDALSTSFLNKFVLQRVTRCRGFVTRCRGLVTRCRIIVTPDPSFVTSCRCFLTRFRGFVTRCRGFVTRCRGLAGLDGWRAHLKAKLQMITLMFKYQQICWSINLLSIGEQPLLVPRKMCVSCSYLLLLFSHLLLLTCSYSLTRSYSLT